MIAISKSLYKVLKKTGLLSWLIVNSGNILGIDARRQALVKLNIISANSKQLLDGVEAQSATLPRLSTVESVDNISHESFQQQYSRAGKPVLLKGLIPQSSIQNWSFDSLKQQYGDLMLLVRKGKDYDRMERFRVALADYIDSMMSGEETYYMGNNLLPEVMHDAIRVPDVLTGGNQFMHRAAQLWIGAQSTGAHLHRDLFDNIVFLLGGSKTFHLASPDESKWLYTWEVHSTLGSSKFDFLNPDYERFPLARKANFISVTMQPGDILYVPCGWFHQVVNHEPSCSVSIFGDRLFASALSSSAEISQVDPVNLA